MPRRIQTTVVAKKKAKTVRKKKAKAEPEAWQISANAHIQRIMALEDMVRNVRPTDRAEIKKIVDERVNQVVDDMNVLDHVGDLRQALETQSEMVKLIGRY